MKLSGQAAVITGASSGIGKAIAIALAAEGAGVALVGRQIDLLEQTAQATGRNTRIYATELTDDTALEQLAYDLRYDWQTINILIHCAGVIASGRVEQAPVAEFDRQYRINVRAPYLLTQVLLPSLRECNGQIVFINSTAGLQARAGVSQYAATKHALRALAESLREELNPEIRVLSVYPGRTASPMQAAVFASEGREYRPERLIQPEDIAALVVHALTLPRSAEVTDLHIRPFTKA
ncbi:MAG: SDR family oxidoreductase [Roseiflexaceae bacterium]|nr:SDR family oxidoreductase [Roseiflexaceae bacterium]